MSMIGDKIKSGIMYISFQERQKRELAQYEKIKERYVNLKKNEQDLEYINLKTKYEYKKNILLAFMVTVIIAVLTGIWKTFYEFGERALVYIASMQDVGTDYTKISVVIFFILVTAISIIFVIIIVAHIYGMKKQYKELLLIEHIREENIRKHK